MGISSSKENPVISISKNGPYLVNQGVPVADAEGSAIEAGEKYALCRCGGSSSKPFCDGTHAKNDFNGKEVADRGSISERRTTDEGDGITIYDDRTVCSHSGRCTDNLASVFKLGEEPWIDPHGDKAEAIANVVKTCPSGALSYALADSGKPVEEEREQSVQVLKDGPYAVMGGVRVESPDGSSYETRQRFTLCRCGGSKNKPFCDGTHWHIGFKD